MSHRLALLLPLALAVCAFGQVTPDPNVPPDPYQQVPAEGFWPTRLMVERWFDRMSEEFAEEYGLDWDQQEYVREVWRERFPAWMNENRAAIMHATNEFLETVLIEQEPTPEDVAEWAARVKPLLTSFHELCETVAEDMKPTFTEDQVIRLESDMETFRYGVGNAQERLDVWIAGGFDAENEWPYRVAEKMEQDALEQRAEAERDLARLEAERAAGGASSQPAAGAESAASQPVVRRPGEKDAWTKYTEDFIARYKLNEDQEQKARTFLRAALDQKQNYLDRRARQHEQLLKAIREADTDEKKKDAQEALARFERPFDRMFERLKQRLDTLPTRAQRKEAGESQEATNDDEPSVKSDK